MRKPTYMTEIDGYRIYYNHFSMVWRPLTHNGCVSGCSSIELNVSQKCIESVQLLKKIQRGILGT